MALRFEIMGYEYSQGTAKSACSKILKKYKANEALEGEDFHFIKCAFETHHYDRDRKFARPIKKIRVVPSKNGKNSEFEMMLDNGSFLRPGISKCFLSKNRKENAVRNNVIEAARNAIRPQQDDMRFKYRSQKKVICHFCNNEITDVRNDLHVDHSGGFDFDKIITCWIESINVDVLSIDYKDVEGAVRRFVDKDLEDNWIKFHKDMFIPKPAHAGCNMSGQ